VVDGGEPGVDSRDEGKHTGRADGQKGMLHIDRMKRMTELKEWTERNATY